MLASRQRRHIGDGPETRSDVLRLASDGVSAEMMRSRNPFVREFACLHGVCDNPRHAHILDTAFDAADEAEFDAISQAIYAPSDW